MKIGIFDSGLGGLIIAKNIIKHLPNYSYVYLGDTKNIPYGSKSQKQIYNFTKQALIKLFAKDCKLVVIACNTSSAKALRKIQREFLPKKYPDRKVLGVIVPTLESIPKNSKKVGILATTSTVNSHAYKKELLKINPQIQVVEQSAPELVTAIEAGKYKKAEHQLQNYINKLLVKKVDVIILGCTHYSMLKKQVSKIIPDTVFLISQDNIIPNKLKSYLSKHSEISKALSKGPSSFNITKPNSNYPKISKKLFGKSIEFKLIKI